MINYFYVVFNIIYLSALTSYSLVAILFSNTYLYQNLKHVSILSTSVITFDLW